MFAERKLRQGARNAVRVCMGVSPADRVLVVTDDETRAVADALVAEAAAVTAACARLRLEDYGARPLARLPEPLEGAVRSFAPTVTFLAVSAGAGEFALQRRFADLATAELGARHASMAGITAEIVREGLRGDYALVQKLTAAVHQLLLAAEDVHLTSSNGTDLHVRLTPETRWVALDGILREPGCWGDLPEGEVFTCPGSAEGVLVADVVGGHFARAYGRLSTPVTVEIEGGAATAVRCVDGELAAALWQHLAAHENGRRVGEIAVGTNVGVRGLSGELLLDEKAPGAHIACGHPHGDLTGAAWSSSTHVDLIPAECTVHVDGQLLLRRGTFAWLSM